MEREQELYRRDAAGCFFAGFVYGMLTATAIALATGCTHAKPTAQLPGVLPVAVVSWPSPIKPDCEVADLPPIPDVFVWTQISDEQAQRVYITQRQLADLVVWLNDVRHWSETTNLCLRKLVQP